jgi:DNA-binding response OmpR family regulator
MILLVEDDKETVDLIKAVFKEYEFDLADSCRSALEKIKAKDYDLIITDVRLPDFTGTYLAESVRKIKKTPIAFLTNYVTNCTREIAGELNSEIWYKPDFLIKPQVYRDKVEHIFHGE